ncbi:MAG: zinc ribbon domain-containing protein [Methanoregula sp.]
MTDQIQFTIKPELLPVLGKISGHPLSPVSPFRYGKDTDTAGGIGLLAALGICDAQGTIAADKKDAVSSLARAESFTRIYLTTPQRVTEYIVYFAPDGKIVGVSNDHGIQLITFPAPNDAMLAQIRQTIGFSRYRSIPFDAHLNRAETLVLSAMIDLQRKEILKKFADGKKADRIAVSAEDVLEMLRNPPENFPWFSGDFVSLFSQARIPVPGDIFGIFASLEEKKHIARAEEKYRLSDEGIVLARSHLLPSMYLTVTTGKGQPSGKTNIAGFSCIISGIHDLLYIDYNADEVELEAVSSAGIHDMVKTFLTDRSVPGALDTKPAAVPEGGNDHRFCPQCGAPLHSGIRFCGTCGAPVT